ncbi:MAG: Hsp70 family protein [Dehalococcoidia bacterium]|nr:Hsp70 family protein [Dehalococcoidia bacterium]
MELGRTNDHLGRFGNRFAGHMLRLQNTLPKGRYLIIDIGGGSTDLAVISVSDSGKPIEVLASAGERFLGGDDIDAALRAIVSARAGLPEIGLSAEASYEFRRQVEQAKRDVTTAYPDDEPAAVQLGLAQGVVSFKDIDLAWQNVGFEHRLDLLVRKVVIDTIHRVGLLPAFLPPRHQALYMEQRSSIDPMTGIYGPPVEMLPWREVCLRQIDGVVPVGGCTRLHQFQRWLDHSLLQARGNDRPLVTIGQSLIGDPVEAVARGGALPLRMQGLSLYRLPYRVFIRDADGATNDLTTPFEKSLPPDGYQFLTKQAELFIVDVTRQEEPSSCVLPAGPIEWRFDTLRTLHIKTVEGSLNMQLPWQRGELLVPVKGRAEQGSGRMLSGQDSGEPRNTQIIESLLRPARSDTTGAM